MSLPDSAVCDEHGCQFLGFAALNGFVGDNKGLVISHMTRGQPPELFSQVRDMGKFTATENDSSSEVQNFLETIEIFLGPVAIN